MGQSLTDKAMIELLLNLYPPLTVDEIKNTLPKNSFEKENDLSTILNELNSTDKSAIPPLFKSVVLRKRGKLRDEMRKKTEAHFRDEVGLDTYQMDRPIGKGKTIMNIDILGRKDAKDICVFVLDEDMSIDSFESFKTMLATILSYAKISPVEIYLILPRVIISKETIEHIKSMKTLKYVKSNGTELTAQLKPTIYESEIPRTCILDIEKEDIFGDKINIGKFSGSSFADSKGLKKFLADKYGHYGRGKFHVKLLDRFTNKTKRISYDTFSTLTSDLTEIVQTTRFEET